MDTLLTKPEAFEIFLNNFQIKTSLFHIELDLTETLE